MLALSNLNQDRTQDCLRHYSTSRPRKTAASSPGPDQLAGPTQDLHPRSSGPDSITHRVTKAPPRNADGNDASRFVERTGEKSLPSPTSLPAGKARMAGLALRGPQCYPPNLRKQPRERDAVAALRRVSVLRRWISALLSNGHYGESPGRLQEKTRNYCLLSRQLLRVGKPEFANAGDRHLESSLVYGLRLAPKAGSSGVSGQACRNGEFIPKCLPFNTLRYT